MLIFYKTFQQAFHQERQQEDNIANSTAANMGEYIPDFPPSLKIISKIFLQKKIKQEEAENEIGANFICT